MTGRPHGVDPLERAIEALLEAGPHLADELARQAGCSLAATRQRLDRLLAQQRVHREKVNLGQPRWQYRWHAGPATTVAETPTAEADTADALAQEAWTPMQRTVHDYPAVGRRDPLVAALFGRASNTH